jgi:hypothetical protein
MSTAIITVTSGPKNATTDPETGLRYYTWKGKRLPSVSSLRRMAGLSFQLHTWAISRVIDRAIDQRDILTAMMERPARKRERVRDKNVRLETSRWLRSASTEERDAAAELGTAVHTAAMSQANVEDVDHEVQPYLRQYQAFLDDSRIEVLAFEKQCFNLDIGYAGSFDLLVRFPNGEVYVIDIKTSGGTYVDHALQLVGYALAEFVGEDDVVDERLTGLLQSATGMALLHLTATGWTFQRIEVTPALFAAFRGLLTFATFMFGHQRIESVVRAQKQGQATP